MRRQDVKIKDIIFRITSIIWEPQFLKHIERTRTSEQRYMKKKSSKLMGKMNIHSFSKIWLTIPLTGHHELQWMFLEAFIWSKQARQNQDEGLDLLIQSCILITRSFIILVLVPGFK